MEIDYGAQTVCLKDKVYVGTSGYAARLYVYTPTTDTWDALIDTPGSYLALTTYHSQLVLVGKKEYGAEKLPNKLWTLSEHGQWQETLPPMPTPCTVAFAVSHGDHLLVIDDEYPLNNIYVYNGHHWASAQHPPQMLYSTMSTVFNGHLYMMGEPSVYSAYLDSLIASCQPSETSQPSSVWKRLPDGPRGHCYPAVFGNRLIAVAGGSIHAYSSFTQSWTHVMSISVLSGSAAPCAVVLPSNELMVVSGWGALKVTLKSKYK